MHATLSFNGLLAGYPELFDDLQVPISIHALLAESDFLMTAGDVTAPSISIHALLAESDRGMQSAVI